MAMKTFGKVGRGFLGRRLFCLEECKKQGSKGRPGVDAIKMSLTESRAGCMWIDQFEFFDLTGNTLGSQQSILQKLSKVPAACRSNRCNILLGLLTLFPLVQSVVDFAAFSL